MANVTLLLDSIESGDPDASAQLLPLIYDELRRLAAHRLANEAPGQTLDPTGLVHEAYLRLVTPPKSSRHAAAKPEPRWDNRGHFFAAAAEAMRRILVENARRKRSLKRGGGMTRRDLEQAKLLAPEPKEDLLALDEALKELGRADHIAAEIVKLRYFGGLPIAAAAKVLRISPRTADRLWSYARAWLHRHMKGKA
jgi:RNA polymerase sigma factor (TIGR02999 family)